MSRVLFSFFTSVDVAGVACSGLLRLLLQLVVGMLLNGENELVIEADLIESNNEVIKFSIHHEMSVLPRAM